MVNYGMLAAELEFPEINLLVRVNIELRDSKGSSTRNFGTDEVSIAKIETVKAFSEVLHYEHYKRVVARSAPVNIESIDKMLKTCKLSDYHIDFYDQLDLFREASADGWVEMKVTW